MMLLLSSACYPRHIDKSNGGNYAKSEAKQIRIVIVGRNTGSWTKSIRASLNWNTHSEPYAGSFSLGRTLPVLGLPKILLKNLQNQRSGNQFIHNAYPTDV